ncbi:ABC transporter ATP-binding protein [Sinirhodobacter populi]|uniref:ABC transporter ATP-binding protein n=1 Tax=Paenirhodobacter populi TaxID=2306993 RepID=A0A443JZL7_9RHOB|nr:ABC transporter ATP-binding protein [Sinirhodobacter populi]RWR25915.1 ABC transporter ATP-binding protein [Sinirhodobacter populi]
MSFLEIKAATKSFGAVNVLSNINLTIERGEFVVFVGPSGCGKSTLLRMITGLEDITSGTISIDGQVVNDVDPARRGTAMVFQSYALYPHMTVAENMSFALRMAGTPKSEITRKVMNAASILRLEQLLDRRPAQLSGGQKQRVAIGRAIVREPRVFLFDEPLSNLDAELRVQMRTELVDLHDRLGTTMIYVTHDQVEALTLADKMVVMNGGIVQQVGPPLTLYDDPDNMFVAGFVGSPKMNLIPARVASARQGRLVLSGIGGEGGLDLPFVATAEVTDEVSVGLRPEDMQIVETAATGGLCLTGRVVLVEDLGAERFVHLEIADGTRIIIRASRAVSLGSGTLRISGDPDRIALFAKNGARIRSTTATRQLAQDVIQ